MAKSKSKNDIKLTSIKKNSVVVKKGAKITAVSKKPRAPKKKLEVVDEVKKEEVKQTEIIKKNTKKDTITRKNTKIVVKKPIEVKKEELNKENKVLTPEEIIKERKERNRKKYQNQQKKYQDNKKNKEKKKIVVEEEIDDKLKKSDTVKEEDLVKKVKQKESKEKEKVKARKEKRKTNRKSINFTQTIINNVKEKTTDKNIPVGNTRDEKARRSKRFIKEAIIYTIILTIIDIVCILIFDYFNFLRLFDVKALNVVVTILIALMFNFFVAFMVDYFVTGVWLQKKRKKKVGEQDGDNRTIEEEHKEDIRNKEGE